MLHRPRPEYLWKELFGRNRIDDKFLYVTDGGHYENLGLVELPRRGCGTIYCFDACGGLYQQGARRCDRTRPLPSSNVLINM